MRGIMTYPRRMWRFACLALVGAVALVPTDAHACGGFFGPPAEGARFPSLGYEQTLLVHDPATEKEHFIREVTFDNASTSFGFVVPTPTRPEVAKVEKSPFDKLRTTFPFAVEPMATGGGGPPGARAASAGGGAPPVQVLEVKQIGSFTAFVLKAEDAGALQDWLRKNKLTSTKEADRWLAHYVTQKFFWVAMRYDGAKKGAPPKLTSETVRISFSTPAPYYPYYEPDPAPGQDPLPRRLMDLWVISPEAVTPVAVYKDSATRTSSWVRPLREGHPWSNVPADTLAPALAALIPKGSHVQTFQDQKVSRMGYGDILFAPASAPADAAARAGKLDAIAAVLDPEQAL